MGRREKLLERARRSPESLRFLEAVALAKGYLGDRVRQSGGHVVFKYPGEMRLINLQNLNGMAKAYQVRQLVDVIDRIIGSAK
jgi:hypothetical protein